MAECTNTTYPAFTTQTVQEYKDDGLTDDQLENIHSRAVARINTRFDALRLDTEENPAQEELRLVLLGKTGTGKSSTGNLIIGKKVFEESLGSTSCTSDLDQKQCDVSGVHVRLIDTPGLFDTDRSPEDILTEIAKVFDAFSDGIHGFLFTYSLGNPRCTDEDKKAFETLAKEAFGPKFFDHCFILLTHANQLTSLEKYLDEEGNRADSYFGQTIQAIEYELFEALKALNHNDLKNMDAMTKDFIVNTVLQKVIKDGKADTSKEDELRAAISVMLDAKIKRLTSNRFLELVKEYGPILKAAGQIVFQLAVFKKVVV